MSFGVSFGISQRLSQRVSDSGSENWIDGVYAVEEESPAYGDTINLTFTNYSLLGTYEVAQESPAYGDTIDLEFTEIMPTVQHYKDGVAIEDADEATLQIANTVENNGSYTLVATDPTTGRSRTFGPIIRNVEQTIVYADPAASGNNDGTSWDDAYTDLQEAIDALEVGQTLYTNSTRALPFYGAFDLNSFSGKAIVVDQGSEGETWFSDAYKGSWTDAGGGIFTIALAAKPAYVVFDFKQDDETGTVTGIDMTRSSWDALRTKVKASGHWTDADLNPWYGFLTENTSTPTSPGSDEWGYSGGTLYINPSGSPTLSNVNNLAEWIEGTKNALESFSSNWSVTGRLIGYLYPHSASNTGYIVKGNGSSNVTIDGVLAICSGYHACGMAGVGGGGGHTLQNCLANGTETGNPFVFYSDTELVDTGNVGTNLSYVHYPLLRRDGRALKDTTIPLGRVCYSHSSGAEVYSGIAYSNIYLFDAMNDILRADGSAFPSKRAGGGLVGASNVGTIADKTDFDSFGVQCINSHGVGFNAIPSENVAFDNCVFDRTGAGFTTDYAMLVIGHHHIQSCEIMTGESDLKFWHGFDGSEEFFMDDTTILMQMTVSGRPGLFGVTGTGARITITNNDVNADGGSTAYCIMNHGAVGIWGVEASIVTSSGNTFNLPNSIQHSNQGVTARDAAYWIANIGATDVFD